MAGAVVRGSLLATLVVAGALGAPAAVATELVYYHAAGCAYCARWEADILPIYDRTDEGAQAPLRPVDAAQPWPADLRDVTPPVFTPTFILIEDGREVDRLPGYSPDFFWPVLQKMLARRDQPASIAK